ENCLLDQPLRRDRVALPAGDYVRISVADKGCGIAPEHLAKIFEPFFTTKRTGEGTGLGLSTAYGIVKQMGGYIFCDSQVDAGTTFAIYFPACLGALPVLDAVPAQPAAGARIAPLLDQSRQPRLLLVEDEAPVRAFAARALKLKGYEVLEADSAEAALALLRDPTLTVDLFLTDVVMPGMDGPTWVRQARRDRPEAAVIFMSGYTEDIFAEGHAKIANSVFLPKPFTLAELSQLVAEQLASSLSGPLASGSDGDRHDGKLDS
ncbi:MAG: ATP-binding protein, partial [Pararhodobacter sp.]